MLSLAKLFSGYYLSGPSYQRMKDAQGLFLDPDLSSALAHLGCRKIHLERPEAHQHLIIAHRRFPSGMSSPWARAVHNGLPSLGVCRPTWRLTRERNPLSL